MNFLSPDQQQQSTEGIVRTLDIVNSCILQQAKY